ncbi:MAG TPA: LysR family transcriptional regulator [Anaeromyxobacteraceae bacterium]|jgi:DNA-binding transcriptional LysR family regulator|nr:LysR family transcriptional regulator [Anaeromyxobacteraceae bacterium]
MELRHLRYFVAVAEELHFGRAAARLGISQPPLSQQVRQLERELGFELFQRSRRRVRLTEAGAVYLEEARAVLERVRQAGAAAGRVARGEAGTLAVGFVASATYGLIPTVFRRFRERHPRVALTLAEMSTFDQVAALRSGRIQLGLARRPVGDEALAAVPLLDEPLRVALPREHRLAARRTVPLRELANEPFVLFPRAPRPGWMDHVAGICREAGFQPEVAQETLELSTTVALVAAGIGVTLVPASAEALQLAGVVYRPLAPPAPRTQLLALHRPDEPAPAVARFLETAREVLAGRS